MSAADTDLARAREIALAVRDAGGRALIVGGWVRDRWLGLASKDVDIEVYGIPAADLRTLLERFGRTAYGCCESLTRKIAGVLTIPNLRIFVCSAWTDLRRVVEAVGDRYAIMWRQKATDVVHAPDMTAIRRHLEDGLRASRGCHRQIVLRELQTLNGDLRRLHRWTATAKEAAENWTR